MGIGSFLVAAPLPTQLENRSYATALDDLGQANVHVLPGSTFVNHDFMARAIRKELENLPFSGRTGMVL